MIHEVGEANLTGLTDTKAEWYVIKMDLHKQKLLFVYYVYNYYWTAFSPEFKINILMYTKINRITVS